jgi:hypothetical protein
MQLQLIAGDYDWTEQGTHVWDANGFSTIITEAKTVEMDQEIYDVTIGFVEAARIERGLNADGSVPESLIPDEP